MKAFLLLLLLIIPPRESPRHPYQHPRLPAWHEGRLWYADVDRRGVIVGYRFRPDGPVRGEE